KTSEETSDAPQRGMIRRDWNPATILVADESEEQSLSGSIAGRIEVKVLDFGLARVTDEDGAGTWGLSQAGQIRGTLPYMSPEQARGATDQTDVRAHLSPLCLILFELLTEQLPFSL